MNWKDVYQLPLHNQELKEGYFLPYVYSANGTMALTFERNINQEVRQMVVMMINGINSNCLENVTNDGAEIYVDNELLMTVRGWGHLTGIGGLNLPENQALKIQDDFISFVVDSLAQKKAEGIKLKITTMRELKFRVWDNVDYMSSEFTLQDIMNRKIGFVDDCPVMQYTGLKDKNGTDIYEGDILESSNEDDIYINGNLSPVEFYAGSFHLTILYDFIAISLLDLETVWIANGCKGDEETSLWLNELEVVGNIHQNSDLIQRTNQPTE